MLAKTPENEKKAAIFDAAANLIKAHGHIKESLGSKSFGFCIRGALMEAVKDIQGDLGGWRVALDLEGLLGFQIQNPGTRETYPDSAVAWNNAPERTKEDVIQRLQEGAKLLRETA
jgi:hypothetical protein